MSALVTIGWPVNTPPNVSVRPIPSMSDGPSLITVTSNSAVPPGATPSFSRIFSTSSVDVG